MVRYPGIFTVSVGEHRLAAILAVIVLSAACSSGAAVAAPNVSTKFKSYSVPGSSAQQLFSHMSRYGPHANGSPALATTAASFSHSAKLDEKRSCRLRDYTVNMSFVITLPKARNQNAMSKPLRKRWKQFASHARWHELQHKAIWIGCAKKIERKVRQIGRQSSCEVAWSKARNIANAELARCDQLHAAFDNKESTRAASLPLIKQALRPTTRTRSNVPVKRRQVSYKKDNRRMGKMYD